MKVRFQADADLNLEIVKGVRRREPAIDFRTANAAGLRGLPDAQVLRMAARDGRVLVTHDRRTMPYEFARFVAVEACPGVLVISQNASVAEAIEGLLLIWAASDAAEWRNLIAGVPL